MNWNVYHLGPIDFGWSNLPTVSDMARSIGGDDAEQLASGFGHSGGIEISTFLARWESAKQAAATEGWEGDFRNEPVVFWLPGDSYFDCGFVIKQDNNGSTFVVSPHPLPYLADL